VTSYGNFGRRKDQRQSPTPTTANQGGEIVVGLCAKIHRSAESADLHNRVESEVECSKGIIWPQSFPSAVGLTLEA
jgi:hypothetical protein